MPCVCQRQNGRMANTRRGPGRPGCRRPGRGWQAPDRRRARPTAACRPGSTGTRGRRAAASTAAAPPNPPPPRPPRPPPPAPPAPPPRPPRPPAGVAAAGAAASLASGSKGDRRLVCCAIGVTFMPTPGISAAPAAAEPATAADVQHRGLVEVDRHLRVVAVGDRARAIAEHAAHDRAAHEQPVRTLDRHAAGDVVLREDRRRRAFGDQRAALAHELHQLHQAFQAHAAADVVGLDRARRGSASRRSSCTAAALRRSSAMPLTCDCAVPPTCGIDDDVVLRAQVALAQLDVGEVGVGHAVRVERGAHPAFVLRARSSCGRSRCAARRGRASCTVGAAATAQRRQARAPSASARAPRDRRSAMMNAPARNLPAARLEVLFGRLHLHVRVLEAERHEVVVGGVLDDQHRTGALRCRRAP